MKKVHQIFMIIGIIYSLVLGIKIIQLEEISWNKNHSYYIAFLIGLIIIYNASKSLFRMKNKMLTK